MIREYKPAPTYRDDIQIPHRTLTGRELHLLFSEIEWKVNDHYKVEDDALFGAREQAQQELAKIAGEQPGTAVALSAAAQLEAADHAYTALQIRQEEAKLALAYLAGQRDGLRLGVRIASIVASGTPVAQIEHTKASLLLAGAMVDDVQADALLSVLLNSDEGAH